MEHPTAGWQSLPTDVKAHITRLLCRNLRDLASCAEASQEMLELARPLFWRAYGCNACGRPAFLVQHMEADFAPSARTMAWMEDGPVRLFSAVMEGVQQDPVCTTLLSKTGVSVGLACSRAGPATDENAAVKTSWQRLFCGGCSRMLGVHVISVARNSRDPSAADCVRGVVGGRYVVCKKYVHLVGPSAVDALATVDMEPLTAGHAHLCRGLERDQPNALKEWLVRAVAARADLGSLMAAKLGGSNGSNSSSNSAEPSASISGNAAPTHVKPQRCDHELFDTRALISSHTRADAAGSMQVQAMYVNHLLSGAFTVQLETGKKLSEGLDGGCMTVANVSCSRCGGRIGFQYTKDLSVGGSCAHLVKRFGILNSAVYDPTAPLREALQGFWRDRRL